MLYELRACQISVVYCAHMTKLSNHSWITGIIRVGYVYRSTSDFQTVCATEMHQQVWVTDIDNRD